MDKKSDLIKLFLKFGKEEHIQDLLENGIVYMNSIEFFRKFEDNGLRGDNFEGITQLNNYPSGEFEIKSLNYNGKYVSLQVRESYENVLGNIFSLYAVSSFTIPNPLEFKIDKRNMEFGSHCLLVKDNPEFLKRIENGLKKMSLKFTHGFVDYYDTDKKNGEINLFEKPNEYKFQNEFRFYIQSGSIEAIKIDIGSLKDIAEMHKSEDVIETLMLVNSS
jgi:hypothetical protein